MVVVFTPNCTIPPYGVNFVSIPNVRPTLDIIWTSLLAIILCTWTALHPAVPPPDQSRIDAFLWKLKWMVCAIIAPELIIGRACSDWVSAAASETCPRMRRHAENSRKPWTMTHAFYANMGGILPGPAAVTTPGPVGISSQAVELVDLPPANSQAAASTAPPSTEGDIHAAENGPAADIERGLHRESVAGPGPETAARRDRALVSASTPQGGGVQVTPVAAVPPTQLAVQNRTTQERSAWNRLKTRILHPNGRSYIWPQRPPGTTDNEPWYNNLEGPSFPFAVNSMQLRVLLCSRVIHDLPSITEDEIKDKGKDDMVVKILALLQVFYLIVQIIVRKTHGLPISQLEIETLSFSLCAGLTYLLWLEKPKDVKTPTHVVICAHRPMSEAVIEQLTWLNGINYFKSPFADAPPGPQRLIRNHFADRGSVIWFRYLRSRLASHPNGYMYRVVRVPIFVSGWGFGFFFGCVIFGASHLLAWNYLFPTPLERVFWRVCSIVCTAAVPALFVMSPICTCTFEFRNRLAQRILRGTQWGLAVVGVIIYILCRLFLIVEAFRSLFFLPPGAFVSTWSANIPHFG
ncbi:hypothetical protein QBC39DRAFT_396602 [Podospora conica]|nr:hypothetical protein QBC39DRAFT_396602 [Schizothecium conicum]